MFKGYVAETVKIKGEAHEVSFEITEFPMPEGLYLQEYLLIGAESRSGSVSGICLN